MCNESSCLSFCVEPDSAAGAGSTDRGQTLHVLAAVEQGFILAGAFLLALGVLIGVDNAENWLLRVRERVERWVGPSLRKEILIGTSTDPRDLEKERAGRLLNLVPYQGVLSIIIFSFLVFYFFGPYVIEQTRLIHGYIGQLGSYRYFLHPLAVILEALILVYAFAIGLAFFWIVFTVPFALGVFLIGLPLLFILSMSIRTLRYFSGEKLERKLGWVGFSLLVAAAILHFYVSE